MPSLAPKHAVVYHFDRQPVEGFATFGFFPAAETIEFISLTGALHQLPYADVKALCLISEAGEFDLFRRQNLFERRPKVPGLWTRFTFRDGDRLDGILSHNLLDWPEAGYAITPPRASTTRQRVFIPRTAVIGTEIRGVVGRSALAARLPAPDETSLDLHQLRMFDS